MASIKTSTFLGVNVRDALLSALFFGITTGVATASGALYNWFHSASLSVNTEQIILALKAGSWAFISDVGRRLLSANKAILTGISKTEVDAIKDGTADVKIVPKSN